MAPPRSDHARPRFLSARPLLPPLLPGDCDADAALGAPLDPRRKSPSVCREPGNATMGRPQPSRLSVPPLLLLMVLGGRAGLGAAFYLPGLAPVSFCEPPSTVQENPAACLSNIKLFVNRLDSVESVLPYEYDAFDFCKDQMEERPPENLGQVLFGERIASSPYKFTFKKDEKCKKVCVKSYDPQNPEDRNKLDFLKKGMQLNYQHHWIIDNMPVTWCYNVEDSLKYCNPGFPVGCYIASDGRIKDFCIMSDEFNKKNTFYLFNHVDITITYHNINNLSCNGPPMEIPAEFNSKLDVIYTYSVKFEENNNIKWASRIMNSLVIVLFLSGMVAMILLRTLHKDIARYNKIDSSEDAQEEFGWKLVHGDVFRPPRKGMLLSVFLGQGTQIFIMTFITLFFACLGFLSPANRGALMTCAVVLWVLLGTPAGYVSARMYKTHRAPRADKPDSSPDPRTILFHQACAGHHHGWHPALWVHLHPALFHPEQHLVSPNVLHVWLPVLSLYHSPDYLFGGHHPALLLPPDYHWWWRSFLTSSFTAVYLFIYAIHYFFSKLQITGIASTILYFGYTMIMVLIFFLFTGTIGFFACFWFVSKIYSVVKVD
ncbi:putative Transmembrane 9 superfamily member protein [Naja naja]|nr:putative Transmembrane 9 superfamily member protein [Naja naja]